MYPWKMVFWVELLGWKIAMHWAYFLRISSKLTLWEMFKLYSVISGSLPSKITASIPTRCYFYLLFKEYFTLWKIHSKKRFCFLLPRLFLFVISRFSQGSVLPYWIFCRICCFKFWFQFLNLINSCLFIKYLWVKLIIGLNP
jgi:hypothetical protein